DDESGGALGLFLERQSADHGSDRSQPAPKSRALSVRTTATCASRRNLKHTCVFIIDRESPVCCCWSAARCSRWPPASALACSWGSGRRQEAVPASRQPRKARVRRA